MYAKTLTWDRYFSCFLFPESPAPRKMHKPFSPKMLNVKKTWLWIGWACISLATPGHAQFMWLNSEPATYENGEPLPGEFGNPAASCLVQLIYAGANHTNNPAIPAGLGVTGDDLVVDWGYISEGDDLGESPGIFPGKTASTGLVPNGYYFVRVWSAPSPDITLGLVSTSPTNRYLDSQLWPYIPPVEFNPPPTFDFLTTNSLIVATTLIPGADSDNDGLPDWWEFLYFGGITNANPTIDSDEDGTDNFSEFLAGTDPTDSASTFEFTGIQLNGTHITIQWKSVTNRAYIFQASPNLFATPPSLITNLPTPASGSLILQPASQDPAQSFRLLIE